MEQTMCRYNRSLLHKKKEKEININIRDVTMIDSVIGWFEKRNITAKEQYQLLN